MSDIKWIKVAVDLFDDEKIALIEAMPSADEILVIWFKLLCFAGKQNNGGIFILNDRIPYTEDMLAAIFRRPTSVIKMALHTFEQLGMIEIVDGAVTIPNWKKHQSMVDKKEYDRIAQQKHRARIAESVNDNVNDKSLNVKDKNKEERIKNKEKDSTRTRFVPPTLEEVAAYCKERNNGIDPQHFIDYQTSRGWVLSNGKKMADWKATIRTWEQRNKKPVVSEQDDDFWKAVEHMAETGRDYYRGDE